MIIKKKLLKTAIMLSLLSIGGVHTSYAAEYTDTISESKDFQNGDIVNVKYSNGHPDGTAIKVTNGKENNITVNGSMTLQGMPLVDNSSGVIMAKDQSTLNFKGDKFIINNLRNPSLYGWGSFGIVAQKNSTINFSSNVDIHSQNCGISIADATFNFLNNTNHDNKLQIFLQSDQNNKEAKEMKGIYANGTLNIDTNTLIDIKGNKNTQASKLGGIISTNANNLKSDLNFNKNTIIDISNGSRAEGIFLSFSSLDKSKFTTAHFGQNTNIYLHNNKNEAIGITVNNHVNANFNNLNIDIDGGNSLTNNKDYYNTGILMQGGTNLTINGTSNITVKNNQKSNHGIFLTQSIDKYHSAANMTIADTNITTANGNSSIGIEVVNSSLTGKDGHTITINSHDGQKNNYGLRVKNGHFNADNVNINVLGNSATGIFIDNNNINQKQDNTDNTTNIKNLNISINGNKNTATGIMSKRNKNKLIIDNATVIVNSETNKDDTYGIVADSGANININESCIVNAKHALMAKKYDYDKSTGKLIINKDFISKHDDAIIETSSGNLIDINTSQTGTVQFSGITKINNNKKLQSVINMNLTNKNAYWHLTGNSNITNLKNDNALIDMTYDKHKFSTLNIINLSGHGGTINMDIDASTNINNSDKIYISGTHSGENFITLNNIATTNENAKDSILISVNNEQGKFLAKDGEGSLYWKKYTLSSKESTTEGYTTDWYLSKVENLPEKPANPQKPQDNHGYTTSVDTILNANALGYYTWINENDTLWQRLGDLRNNKDENQGIWFRTNSTKLSGKSKYNFTNKFTSYHLGYDFVAQKTPNKLKYQGIAFSYADGESNYAKGNGDSHSKSLSLYNTELYSNGSYFDLILKTSDIDNDFSVFDSYGQNIIGEADNKAISLSAEYGRKYDLAHNWFIEPQAQMTMGYYDADDYHTNNGIRIEQSNISSVIGRLGFNIGKKFNNNSIFYLKANLLHEFSGDFDITMRDKYDTLYKNNNFSHTWFEYGLGIAMSTSENSNIYLDFERSTSDDFDKNWQWNAGVRWIF